MASATATSSMATTTNIMLAIYEKKTSSVDLYHPVRDYIAVHYSDSDFQNLEDDLQTLNQLRSDVEKSTGSLPYRRDILIRYFKALCSAGSIFPFSPEPNHINTVLFTWFDAFKNKNKSSQANLDLEKAAVVFNLGAVYSQIGLSFDRSTTEGRKQAVLNFSGAAGAFAYLRDRLAAKAVGGGSVTVDLSFECAGALERLMLAQALECVYENTIAKGSTHGVCANISRQVGIYYKEAFDAVIVVSLNQHFDKMWITQVQLKAVLFSAESCFRHSLELHEKVEIGEEITRLKIGISALADVKKFSTVRGAPVQLLAAVNKLKSNLSKNLERAVKENASVYFQSLPSSTSLTTLPAISLVKPMPMDDVLDASEEDMFGFIVPDTSAKAFPRYTETADKVIGLLAQKLEIGSELARMRLKELHLPDSIVSLEEIGTLPEELKDEVEAVQISGGLSGLEAKLQQLRHSRRVNQELLAQTEEMLQKEAQEDGHFRAQYGGQWTRSQSSALNKNLQDRVKEFAAKLQHAADNENEIERSVREHSARMSILDRLPIKTALPTLVKPMMSLDADEGAIIGALKQSLRQLETLGVQRVGLQDMLKELKTKDDILPELMACAGSHMDIVNKVVAKFDKISVEVSEYIEAQEHILEQIQAQSDQLSAILNLEDFKASCEKCNEEIQSALAKYQEIKENINKGLKLYATIQDAINDVKQQCSDFVRSGNIECHEMIDQISVNSRSMVEQTRREANTDPYYYQSERSHPSPFAHPQSDPTVNEYRKPVYPGRRNPTITCSVPVLNSSPQD
ncbi:hypothetical protein V2J09_003966 [Rumex salicifolius]